jgi:hypothetical protein
VQDRKGANLPDYNFSQSPLYGNGTKSTFFIIVRHFTIRQIKLMINHIIGWVVRIYHNLTTDDAENWKTLTDMVEKARINNRNHIDLCNVSIIARNRKLGDMFAMTWRWVMENDCIIGIIYKARSFCLFLFKKWAMMQLI